MSVETAEPVFTRNLHKVVNDLDTDPEGGLDAAEAQRRLAAHGPNELVSAPPPPLWGKVLAQFQDPLVYLLLVAVVISLITWWLEGRHGLPVDAIVITLIVIANAVLGFVQESRAEQAVAALQQMSQPHATVLREGQQVDVNSADIVPGDLLVLGEGDSIAADGRLVQASALHVAEAALTGESTSVTKKPGELTGKVALGDRTNMVFRGTAVTQGTGLAVVTATGMATEMGSIADLLGETHRDPTPLEREIAQVGKALGIAVVVITVVVMATVWLVNGVSTVHDAIDVLLLGVSLAVAAVPEGLPAILSVVLSIGVQRMASCNAIVKKLSSVETLGSASVICSDKTGTLTRNEMTVQEVRTASGTTRVSGTGYAPEGEVAAESDAEHHENRMMLSGGALASNAQLNQEEGDWQIAGDPTEAAFLVAERKLGTHEERERRFTRVAEVPFTSERKRMSTINRVVDAAEGDPGELLLVCKGAPDVVLERCTRQMQGTRTIDLTDEARAQATADIEQMSHRAMRTLGVAYRSVTPDEVEGFDADEADHLEHELIWVGSVGIIDPARDEAADAVEAAHRAGVRVMMITGDHPVTALRIARDLGIAGPDDRAVTGLDLDDLDEAAFDETVRSVNVYARVAPQHKLRIVSALKKHGQVVAMTGDGVNDAPALKAADIGVAMGITGTEVTKQTGSMILRDDNFATIVAAIEQGRIIFDDIKKFLRYLLSSNMGEVLTVFLGVLLASVIGLQGASGAGLAIPLLATQILWINLVTDSGPALALGMDGATDDVMARRPRALDDRVIDTRMWVTIVFVGLVMALSTLATIDFFLVGGLINGNDDLAVARTAGFTTLVFAQLFNVFSARSPERSAFHKMFSNRWLIGAVVLGVVLQIAVVEVPFLQQAFGTASLDLRHWLLCVGMASLVLWAEEARKIVTRWRHRG